MICVLFRMQTKYYIQINWSIISNCMKILVQIIPMFSMLLLGNFLFILIPQRTKANSRINSRKINKGVFCPNRAKKLANIINKYSAPAFIAKMARCFKIALFICIPPSFCLIFEQSFEGYSSDTNTLYMNLHKMSSLF